ncbi:MAG: sulfotransferase [Chloroflexota bacterium]
MSQQPFPVRMINTVGKLLSTVSIPDLTLDPDQLCEIAIKRTGLSDFGDPAFQEGYRCLIESADNDANLNFLGRMTIRTMLIDSLKNRLLLMGDRKRRPEVYEKPLLPPIIVTGLPRSGTTFLHRLLAVDPSSRALPFWELMRPLPYSEPDRRYEEIKNLTNLRFKMTNSGLDRKHFIRADTPEECIFLMTPTFVSKFFWVTIPATGYAKWYAAADRYQSYREYSWFLQALQDVESARRLLLKAPAHLGSLDALIAAVPDAMLIQLYRDPVPATTSLFSLYTSSHSLSTENFDVHSMVQNTLGILEKDVQRNLEFRADNPDRIYDVHYTDLISNPLDVVQQVYGHFDVPWTDELEAGLQDHIAQNPQGKHGVHQYRTDDFGITEEELTRKFREYIEAFARSTDKSPV